MQVCEFIFTARLSRPSGASLKTQRTQRIIIFPLPLTPVKWLPDLKGQGRRQGKSSKQLTLRKRQKASILLLKGANTVILLPEGLSRFAFRVLRPGGSGAYPSGSAKSKKNQKLCVLCASAVNKFYKDPFRVTIKPPLLGVVIDLCI